jgi:hypothetical protein
MHTQLSNHADFKLYAFHPTFESINGIIAEHYIYVFDKQGRLIEGGSVVGGKALIELAEDELIGAHLVLGPSLEGLTHGPVSLEDIRSFHVFEAAWVYEPGRRSYALSPVPEHIWRWWLVHSLWNKLRRRTRDTELFLM